MIRGQAVHSKGVWQGCHAALLISTLPLAQESGSGSCLLLSLTEVLPMHFTTLPGFTAGHLQREALSGSPTCAGSTQIAGAPLPTLQSFMGQISRTLPWHCGPASAEEGASATGDSIGGMREPKTGALFPPRFCQRGDTHCGTLQGLG